tara:strand:- start:628 stop:954 length:327 start_codon:yes stop_codon:yes gene_type:complete
VKISKRQIRNIVSSEISRSQQGNRTRHLEIDVNSILREQRDLDEGMFSSAAKALATKFVPGGRMASDYLQARGFDDLEDATEALDARLDDLESRIAALESGGSLAGVS